MDLSLLAQVMASEQMKKDVTKGFGFMQGHGDTFDDIFDVKLE